MDSVLCTKDYTSVLPQTWARGACCGQPHLRQCCLAITWCETGAAVRGHANHIGINAIGKINYAFFCCSNHYTHWWYNFQLHFLANFPCSLFTTLSRWKIARGIDAHQMYRGIIDLLCTLHWFWEHLHLSTWPWHTQIFEIHLAGLSCTLSTGHFMLRTTFSVLLPITISSNLGGSASLSQPNQPLCSVI